jgi:polysaccharide export outer membrane protein
MKKRISYYVAFFLLTMIILLVVHEHFAQARQGLSSPLFALGPEDILEISVWKDEALTKQVVVRPDGWISFPLIGDIQAAGRTVEELRQEIQTRIKTYVPDAPVTVMVMKVGSPKVYVVGKVAKPGVYIMGEPMRVMQVLAVAGGATPFADKNSILIIREENNKQVVYKFNYDKVSKGKELEQNINLKPGDTVVVP